MKTAAEIDAEQVRMIHDYLSQHAKATRVQARIVPLSTAA